MDFWGEPIAANSQPNGVPELEAMGSQCISV
jgi:hypothetical protein